MEKWEQAEVDSYDGIVSGSEGKKYVVHINKLHPRKSTCNYPFADGRRVVCKHMIVLYFTTEQKTVEEIIGSFPDMSD